MKDLANLPIEKEMNDLIKEKLFLPMRKIIANKHRDLFTRTSEYQNAKNKKELLDQNYKKWYEITSRFFLSLRTIYALHPLVERESKIREFASEEIIRVKADYSYGGIDFSAYVPTHYNVHMQREINDCIADLKNRNVEHIVDNFIERKDTERAPYEPLTTAQLKYSAYYLFGFEPEYVSKLCNLLYEAEVITNPETVGWDIPIEAVEEIITILNRKYGEECVLQYKRKYTDSNIDRSVMESIRPISVASEAFPKNFTRG